MRFLVLVAGLLVIGASTSGPAFSQMPDGHALYRVTTLRAAPGKLLDLIEALKDRPGTAPEKPMIMRHSQGDQWDLLVLEPVDSYAKYFARRGHRPTAFERAGETLAVFREDLFAYGPPAAETRKRFAESGLFHIEMFAALAGKKAALLDQRRIENTFSRSIGRPDNLIWRGDLGSDIDVFTIGFYRDLAHFAAPAPVTDAAEVERLAKKAGFAGRAFIGTYLRELIARHHDTLATKIE